MEQSLIASAKTRRFSWSHLFGHLVLIGGGLVFIYPLLFMLLASLFTSQEYMSRPISLFPIAQEPSLKNLLQTFSTGTSSLLQTFAVNSILRAVYYTLWAVLTSFLAGYVFSRLKFRWREGLFMLLISSQMIPQFVGVLPTYLELAYWPFTGGKGILDTPWVYIVLNGGAVNIMGMFIVKQSMEKLPYELDEAAKMDGAGPLRLIFQIILPLQKPILAYVAITSFIYVWNDWGTPFFYTNSESLQTLASGLSRLTAFSSAFSGTPDYPFMMTLSLLLTIPCVVIFFFFQKLIVQGLANTGIKG